MWSVLLFSSRPDFSADQSGRLGTTPGCLQWLALQPASGGMMAGACYCVGLKTSRDLSWLLHGSNGAKSEFLLVAILAHPLGSTMSIWVFVGPDQCGSMVAGRLEDYRQALADHLLQLIVQLLQLQSGADQIAAIV